MGNIKTIGKVIITEENISIEDFTYGNGTWEKLKKDALEYAKLRIEAELSLITKQ